MNTDLKKVEKPQLLQTLNYAGKELELYIEPDGNASVYLAPGRELVYKSDVISQCWHLAKWRLRSTLTRVKLIEATQKAKF